MARVPLVSVRHLLSSSYNLCSAGYCASCFIVITQHVFRWYVMFYRHHTTRVPLVRHLLSSAHNTCSAGTSSFIVITQHVFRWYVIFYRHHTTRVPLVRHLLSSSHNMCSAGSVGYRMPCFILSTLQSRILPVTVMFHRHVSSSCFIVMFHRHHTAYYLVFPWLPYDMFHYYHTTLSLCLFSHSALPRQHTEQKTLAMRTVRTNADETYLQTKGNKRRSNIKQKQQNVIMQWPLQPYIHIVKV